MDPTLLKVVGAVLAVLALVIGIKVSLAMVVIMATCIAMLAFSTFLARWVLAKDEGTQDMQEVGAGWAARWGWWRAGGRCLQIDLQPQPQSHTHTHGPTGGGALSPLQISQAIRDGAEGYFATQYGTIARLAGVLAAIIFAVYLFRRWVPGLRLCVCVCVKWSGGWWWAVAGSGFWGGATDAAAAAASGHLCGVSGWGEPPVTCCLRLLLPR